MYYIKLPLLLIFALIAYGCAQEIQPDTSPEQQGTPKKTIESGTISTSQSEVIKYKKAITYIFNNELDKAQPVLTEFTEQRPELAGPWANLGLIKLKQNDYTAAENYIKTALEKNSEMPQALNLMGTIRVHQGKILEAEQLYKKSLAIKPDYPLAHYNLALLYDVYLQNIPAAIEHYQAYLKLTNNEDKGTRDWLEQLINSQKLDKQS